jgi:hypothetical protein
MPIFANSLIASSGISPVNAFPIITPAIIYPISDCTFSFLAIYPPAKGISRYKKKFKKFCAGTSDICYYNIAYSVISEKKKLNIR